MRLEQGTHMQQGEREELDGKGSWESGLGCHYVGVMSTGVGTGSDMVSCMC